MLKNNMKHFILLLLVLCSCTRLGVDLDPPEIEDHYPKHNQYNIPNSTTVWIRFNEGMDKASVEKAFRIDSEAKSLYHAAAVVTNNFTTVLQAIALEAWKAAGAPTEVARDLNATLLQSTVENIGRLDPAEALTGPAARGDVAVVEAEVRDMTAWHPEAGRIYEVMSVLAARLKASGTTLAPDCIE